MTKQRDKRPGWLRVLPKLGAPELTVKLDRVGPSVMALFLNVDQAYIDAARGKPSGTDELARHILRLVRASAHRTGELSWYLETGSGTTLVFVVGEPARRHDVLKSIEGWLHRDPEIVLSKLRAGEAP